MQHSEDGFGLVEVMISMVIFGVIAAASIPLFITSIQVSARNSSIAHATQMVHEGLEVARAAAQTGDCNVIATRLAALPDSTDPRGIPFDVQGSMANCDASLATNLATVTVTVTTTADGFGSPVATATTQVFVKLGP